MRAIYGIALLLNLPPLVTYQTNTLSSPERNQIEIDILVSKGLPAVTAPTCANVCTPRVCPADDECCHCEEHRRTLYQVSYTSCLKLECGEDVRSGMIRALDAYCPTFLDNCKATELMDEDDQAAAKLGDSWNDFYYYNGQSYETDDERRWRLARRALGLKLGLSIGLGVTLIVIVLCCWCDHRKKKKRRKKMRAEEAEKAAALTAAQYGLPPPAKGTKGFHIVVSPGSGTLSPAGSSAPQGNPPQKPANTYFPQSSTANGGQEDDLVYQERRLQERREALAERKRIAAEEEALAAEEEEFRRRTMGGMSGRGSSYGPVA